MNNKLIAILGAAVISAGAIGGVAFASGIDSNPQIVAKVSSVKASILAMKNGDIKVQDIVGTGTANNSSVNRSNVNVLQTTVEELNENAKTAVNEISDNTSKDIYEDMIKIMRDNGFKDAGRYMETGNYAAMADYMNNLSQEDYDKMIEIMNDNGYGYMAQMMQSIGREGMVQMHNSMMGNGGYPNGMMDKFR